MFQQYNATIIVSNKLHAKLAIKMKCDADRRIMLYFAVVAVVDAFHSHASGLVNASLTKYVVLHHSASHFIIIGSTEVVLFLCCFCCILFCFS